METWTRFQETWKQGNMETWMRFQETWIIHGEQTSRTARTWWDSSSSRRDATTTYFVVAPSMEVPGDLNHRKRRGCGRIRCCRSRRGDGSCLLYTSDAADEEDS